MPDTLTYPEAFALIGGLAVAVIGIINFFNSRRDSVSQRDLRQSVEALAKDHGHTKGRVDRLETTLEGKVETQFAHFQDSMRRLEDKMDTLVTETIAALGRIAESLGPKQ